MKLRRAVIPGDFNELVVDVEQQKRRHPLAHKEAVFSFAGAVEEHRNADRGKCGP